MRGWSSIAVVALVLATVSCFRSTSKIPPPGEGLFVTGVVVARDLTSAEITGVQGAKVTVIGGSKTGKEESKLARAQVVAHSTAIRGSQVCGLSSLLSAEPDDGC